MSDTNSVKVLQNDAQQPTVPSHQPVVTQVVFECPICYERKVTRASLRRHLQVLHNVHPNRSRRVQRVMESKVRRVLVDHLEEEGKSADEPAAPPLQETPQRPAKPPRTRRASLEAEQQKSCENGELDILYYNCRVCFMAFSGMEGLEVHIQKEHPQELASKVASLEGPILECWYCEKSFCSKTNVVRHVVQFHHGYRPYKCLLCSEGAYTDKRKMMNHLLNVHNIVNDQLNNNKEVRKASYQFHSKPPFNVDPIPKDMYFIA